MNANAEMRGAKDGRAVCSEEEEAQDQETQWTELTHHKKFFVNLTLEV